MNLWLNDLWGLEVLGTLLKPKVLQEALECFFIFVMYPLNEKAVKDDNSAAKGLV